jgi:hypothetical protein
VVYPQGWFTLRGGLPSGVVYPEGWFTLRGGLPSGVVCPKRCCAQRSGNSIPHMFAITCAGKIAERGEGDRKRQLLEKLCARVKPENKPSGRKCAHQLALVPFEDSD